MNGCEYRDNLDMEKFWSKGVNRRANENVHKYSIQFSVKFRDTYRLRSINGSPYILNLYGGDRSDKFLVVGPGSF
jgi:hypothetical protein